MSPLWLGAAFLALSFGGWYSMPPRSRSRAGRAWSAILLAAFVCTMIGFCAMPMGRGHDVGDAHWNDRY